MDTKESQLQAKILKYLNSLRACKAIKILSANERGIPDVHVCYKGRYIVFEIKTRYGKITRLQGTQLHEYHKAEAVTVVIRSLNQVKEIMEQIMTE